MVLTVASVSPLASFGLQKTDNLNGIGVSLVTYTVSIAHTHTQSYLLKDCFNSSYYDHNYSF